MKIRVADEVWIATALLHRRHPDRDDFTVGEIVRQAEIEKVADGPLRAGVRTHIYQHCVANKAPASVGRYRMLFETSKGRRRLFRPGDPFHPRRSSGKDVPRDAQIPPAYRGLIDWYRNEYASGGCREADPILSLRGLGKAIWADEDADTYVDRLREGWGVSRVYGGPDRFAAFAPGTPASPAQLQSIAEAGRPSRRVGYEIRILGV